MKALREELNRVLGQEHVKTEEPMAAHTSFQVGGAADYFLTPQDERGLTAAIRLLRREGLPFEIIGNGTNLLVRDGGYRGAILQLGEAFGAVTVCGTEIFVGAGALLSVIATRAAGSGLAGMEFAGGIPGSLGGALFMNAGAYDGEMSQIVRAAKVYDIPGDTILTMKKEEMALGYRSSFFQGGAAVILSATLVLQRGEPDEIRARGRELTRRRNEKQPMELPSAGSFFKRPVGGFAGQLIEEAGLKGRSVGGAQVSEKHAGFLVNRGGATAKDILTLMEQVQAAVFQRSGILLEPEPRFIGEEERG